MNLSAILDHRAFQLVELPHLLHLLPGAHDHDRPIAKARASDAERGARDRWVRAMAARYGLDATSISLSSGELEALLATGHHVLIVADEDRQASRALLARRCGSNRVELFSPGKEATEFVSIWDLTDWLSGQSGASFIGELDVVLEGVGDLQARARVRRELIASILGTRPIAQAWIIRPSPAPGFVGRLRAAGMVRRGIGVFALYAAQYVAYLSAWAMLGNGMLSGRVDRDLLWGALLLFASAGLFRVLSSLLVIDAVIAMATVMKRWLYRGALQIDIDSASRYGTGELIGLVLESNQVEKVALDGVLLGLLALVECAMVLGILLWSPMGRLAGLGYLGLLVAIALAARLHHRAWLRWSRAKTRLTGELIEGVVGHRTRLAQCPPDLWYEREEALLEQYRKESMRLDKAHFWLHALLGRASVVVGLLALMPSVARASANGELAVLVGAVLLANSALARVAMALTQINGARVAFERVAPLFGAASTHATDLEPPHPRTESTSTTPLLEARSLCYRYPRARADVLQAASLQVRQGERILIEAPSGVGKSTLIAILSGLREADSGGLQSRGIDKRLLTSADWGERVVAVPQFNRNHIFSGSVAFNCLMGRVWPPTTEDVAHAEQVLRALALGPLLDAMPSGMEQALGETGWRLSHGERSRLFVARALLQDPDVLLVDESFGALDPDTFLVCLRYIEQATRAVVMVAHR